MHILQWPSQSPEIPMKVPKKNLWSELKRGISQGYQLISAWRNGQTFLQLFL